MFWLRFRIYGAGFSTHGNLWSVECFQATPQGYKGKGLFVPTEETRHNLRQRYRSCRESRPQASQLCKTAFCLCATKHPLQGSRKHHRADAVQRQVCHDQRILLPLIATLKSRQESDPEVMSKKLRREEKVDVSSALVLR